LTKNITCCKGRREGDRALWKAVEIDGKDYGEDDWWGGWESDEDDDWWGGWESDEEDDWWGGWESDEWGGGKRNLRSGDNGA
jgi:hypothetical protein